MQLELMGLMIREDPVMPVNAMVQADLVDLRLMIFSIVSSEIRTPRPTLTYGMVRR